MFQVGADHRPDLVKLAAMAGPVEAWLPGRRRVLPPPKRGGHDPVESNQRHAFQP